MNICVKFWQLWFGADETLSEAHGEKNLRISVYDEGRRSIYLELLDLVVVGGSSGYETGIPGASTDGNWKTENDVP